ncbi:MAG: alanine/glycine:cation symporter family protein [Planctomycetota bacterium]
MPVYARLRLLLIATVCGAFTFSSPFADAVVAQDSAAATVTTDNEPAAEGSTPAATEAAATGDAEEVAPEPPAVEQGEESEAGETGFQAKVNDAFGALNGFLASGMFWNVANLFGMGETVTIPLAVFWLVAGAIFFTIRMGFINFRGFRHAVLITAGRYDNKHDHGEVSHFQALTAALSATVGLGNIAGVAIAISTGGPGATFWMIMAGFLGMSSKFVECTLGQKYREVRPDGRVMGGAMYYLSRGLERMGLGPLGSVLAIFFAILCIGGSFGGGCAFQVNQSLNAVKETVPFFDSDANRWVYGLIMAGAVGIVIIGGIKSIARVAEKIVPLMCGVYVVAALFIIGKNFGDVPNAIGQIFSQAFSPDAAYGGFLGVLVVGFQRAAFSNEAGTGSAAIAHAAAKTDYPIREGMVALLGPFIDTVIVCTMTAIVIVITGAYDNPDPAFVEARTKGQGATLTSLAMDAEIEYFKYVLSIAVCLFAYSTMISWSYYGERCSAYLFGDRASLTYRIIFLVFVFLGSIVSATNVLEFGDLMILGMAFPNIVGVVLLSGSVAEDLKVYWQQYLAGEFEVNRASTD